MNELVMDDMIFKFPCDVESLQSKLDEFLMLVALMGIEKRSELELMGVNRYSMNIRFNTERSYGDIDMRYTGEGDSRVVTKVIIYKKLEEDAFPSRVYLNSYDTEGIEEEIDLLMKDYI